MMKKERIEELKTLLKDSLLEIIDIYKDKDIDDLELIEEIKKIIEMSRLSDLNILMYYCNIEDPMLQFLYEILNHISSTVYSTGTLPSLNIKRIEEELNK